MNDLIDREQLRHALYEEAMVKDSEDQKWDSGCWIRYRMAERLIKEAPSVQTEIIRCKDCTFAVTTKRGDYLCSYWEQFDSLTETDFCSRAERRTE